MYVEIRVESYTKRIKTTPIFCVYTISDLFGLLLVFYFIRWP